MPPTPLPDPESTPGLDLEALRERLRSARAERGACPPWDELRADLLPGGGARAGREARWAHRELCPYCDAHVREWERSTDRTADTLEAVEQHVARGVVEGARRLIALGSTRAPAAATPTPAAPLSPGPAPAPERRAKAPLSIVPPPTYTPPPVRPATSPEPVVADPPVAPVASPGLRLLVVEATAVERIPSSVFLCAQVLGAEVAQVASVDELAGDPDLDAVCAIVFAGARPSSEWPEALRRGRDLAPGRPVLILAGGGAPPRGGALRALRGALLSVDDPAELLLLALDPRLR